MRFAPKTVGIGLGALALWAVAVHGAQYFRIAGPVATTITSLSADGYITWTNSPTNATFAIQTTQSLPGGTNWVAYLQVPVAGAVTAQRIYDPSPPPGMVLIPAGTFTMGDTLDGESDAIPTVIYVSAFYMDSNLVSYTLWTNVYQWATTHGYGFDNAGAGKASTHPVQRIDWYDCVKWCNARSEMEGQTPAYYTSAAQTTVYRNGAINLSNACVNWSTGYRLPTEAEWEKAARGGLSGQRFPWGNTISESQANYYGDPLDYSYDLGPYSDNALFATGGYPYTSPVGYFAPNGYGLYDMDGNVWQWCWDRYGTPYAGGSDPRGPGSGSYRVYRGGGWDILAINCRTAFRDCYYPGSSVYDYGFRSVLPPGQ